MLRITSTLTLIITLILTLMLTITKRKKKKEKRNEKNYYSRFEPLEYSKDLRPCINGPEADTIKVHNTLGRGFRADNTRYNYDPRCYL